MAIYEKSFEEIESHDLEFFVRLLCLLIEVMTKKKKRIMSQLMRLFVDYLSGNQKSKSDDIFVCVDLLSLRLCCATTEGVLHCAFQNELLVLFPLKLQSVQRILRDAAVDISLFSGSALHHVAFE